MTPIDNQAPAARNLQLDGLRGYAAVSVAIFHTILGMDETLIPRIVYGRISDFSDTYSWFAKIVLKLFSGETAVLIFFVLSGTVLFQSLMRSKAPYPEVSCKLHRAPHIPDLSSARSLSGLHDASRRIFRPPRKLF